MTQAPNEQLCQLFSLPADRTSRIDFDADPDSGALIVSAWIADDEGLVNVTTKHYIVAEA